MIKPPKPGKLFELADLRGKIAERDLYRNFDALITGSNHMTGMLHKNGFAPERVYTIPYFSRFAEYADVPMAKELGAASARPLELLFSGQAVKGKGLEILVSALHGVRGNWRLTVFSEGVRLEHAKTLAAELGIAERIDFRGWVTQSALAEAYRRADLFVLPSIWDDPGPLVGIEAMSFGTPVVGFAVGGIPDYLIDRKTGFLVTDTTAAGLRRTLQFCVESPMMLPILGAAGQKRVALHHTPAIHKENISMVYNKVLKTGEKTY